MQILKKLFLFIFIFSSIGCSAGPVEPDFQSYWNKFRSASLALDYTTLVTLTKFPLEVKGVDDSTPVKKYEKTQFNDIFPKLLSQPVFQYKGDDVIETTLKDLVIKQEKVEYKPADTQIRVEQFEFRVVDGKWLLVRAYLEE